MFSVNVVGSNNATDGVEQISWEAWLCSFAFLCAFMLVMVELLDRMQNENIELKARVTHLEAHIAQWDEHDDTLVTQLNEWKRRALNAERECTVHLVRALNAERECTVHLVRAPRSSVS